MNRLTAEKVRDVPAYWFDYFSSCSLFTSVCPAAADSSMGNVLQSEADESHRE